MRHTRFEGCPAKCAFSQRLFLLGLNFAFGDDLNILWN